MLRKFVDGLLFGCGFSISLVIVWYAASLLFFPIMMGTSGIHETTEATHGSDYPQSLPSSTANEKPFHELDLDKQIEQSSVVALAKFEPSKDGQTKAIIKEFLKKDPETAIYYKIGDEYAPSSYYPKENTSHGDGVIIFFVGSPASMRMSMSYEGDRIRSLGDIPLELLREKCTQPAADNAKTASQ